MTQSLTYQEKGKITLNRLASWWLLWERKQAVAEVNQLLKTAQFEADKLNNALKKEQKELRKLKHHFSLLTGDKNQLEQKLVKMEEWLASREEEIAVEKAAHVLTQKNLTSVQEEKAGLQKELLRVGNIAQTAITKFQQEEAEHSHLKKEFSSLERVNSQQETQLELLAGELGETKDYLENLKQEYSSMTNQLRLIEKDRLNLKTNLAQEQADHANTKGQNAQLQQQISGLQKTKEGQENQLNLIHKELAQTQTKLSDLRHQLEQKIAKMEEWLASREEEIAVEKAAHVLTQKNLTSVQEEKAGLQKELLRVGNIAQTAITKFQQEEAGHSHLKKEFSSLERVNSQQETQLKLLAGELGETKDCLENLKQEYFSMTNQLQLIENDRSDLKNNLIEEQANHADTKEKNTQLQQKNFFINKLLGNFNTIRNDLMIDDSLCRKLQGYFGEHGNKVVQPLIGITSKVALLVKTPSITQKMIVAIGGASSSGKSSFVNNLLDKRNKVRLPFGIQGETVLPTYILNNQDINIELLTTNNDSIKLDGNILNIINRAYLEEVFESHRNIYNKLSLISVQTPWQEDYATRYGDSLCFVDLPGFNQGSGKNSSDQEVIKSVIATSDILLWFIGIDSNGEISSKEMDFIYNHCHDIPTLIVLSKIDSKPQGDVEEIYQKIQDSIEDDSIEISGMCTYSNQGVEIKCGESYISLLQFLDEQCINKNSQLKNKLKGKLEGLFDQYEIDLGNKELGVRELNIAMNCHIEESNRPNNNWIRDDNNPY